MSSRDKKLRCIKCGSFAAGLPMCEKCTEVTMKEVEKRRRRMSFVFYSIVIMAIVTYFYLL